MMESYGLTIEKGNPLALYEEKVLSDDFYATLVLDKLVHSDARDKTRAAWKRWKTIYKGWQPRSPVLWPANSSPVALGKMTTLFG